MKILALDTATHACSAALLHRGEITQRFVVAPGQHTNFILPMIDELITVAGIDLSQLDAIAFGAGPGSFTGARLAASLVQGLAMVNNTPIIKISTLRAIAQEIFTKLGETKVAIALDARMAEVYFGEYELDHAGIMQAVISDKLIQAAAVGANTATKIYDDELLKDYEINVQAGTMVKIAAADFTQGLVTTVEQALPVYLREEIAWNVAG